jgi:hypothetical protein
VDQITTKPINPDEQQEKAAMVRLAGGVVMGVSKHFEVTSGYVVGQTYEVTIIWFNDPETSTSLAMRADDVTSVETVREHIARSRAAFDAGKRRNEERSEQ